MEQTPTPSLSISQSLEKAWEDVKKNILLFAGFALLFYAVFIVFGMIPFIGRLSGLFGFILTASVFNAFRTVQRTGKLDFNDFFAWTPAFGRLFVGNLLVLLITIVLAAPLIIAMVMIFGAAILSTNQFQHFSPDHFNELFAGVSIGLLLLLGLLTFIAGIVMSIALFAYTYLIQFKELSYTDSLKLSWKIGTKNIGSVIVFFFLSIGLGILGVIACCVGIFVVIPIILGTQYYFIDSMFPQNKMQEEWDFMKDNPGPVKDTPSSGGWLE